MESKNEPVRRRPKPTKEEIDQFWKEFNEAYAALKSDPEAYAEYKAECALFDNAIGDGLFSPNEEIP